jgi:hypothetical protein
MKEGDREFFRLRNLNTYRQLKYLGKMPLEMQQPKSKIASRPKDYDTLVEDSIKEHKINQRGKNSVKTSKTKQRATLIPSLI